MSVFSTCFDGIEKSGVRMRLALIAFAFGNLLLSGVASAQFSQQGPKLVSMPQEWSTQGWSVALSADGNTAIVGGPMRSDGGAAWIWTRTGEVWTQQAKLAGSGAVNGAEQGYSVALSADGNTAAVGGPIDNLGPGLIVGVGATWIWTRSGGVWTQQARLVGADAIGYSGQGSSVALSGDGNTLMVGGPTDNGSLQYSNINRGGIYVGVAATWVWTRSGGVWTQQAKLVGVGGGHVRLSSDGNTANLGGDIWTKSNGIWERQENAPGPSVALSGDGNTLIAFVGGTNQVADAQVWVKTDETWFQQGDGLVGSGAVLALLGGVSLSYDGDTVIVGGFEDSLQVGAAWVWTRCGGVWTQQGQKLVGSGGVPGYQEQGWSVALSADGNTALVGGIGDNGYVGAAWVFTTHPRTVPIVVSTPGLSGSFFTTELVLTNRGSSDASISYTYTPAFGGQAGAATDLLAAGAQKIIPDAVEYLKSLGIPVGDTGSRGGTLRIGSSGDVAATVRTTTAVPNGRAGLAYAGLSPSQLLTDPVYVCGLRQNDSDRSNVAVENAGTTYDGPITLRVTVVSGDPAQPQTQALPDVTLPPGGFTQISGVLASNGLALTNGYVRIERVAGTGPFYAYGAINDQVTSDGSFVDPVPANPPSTVTGVMLPVLVETSAYSSELVVTNFSMRARTLHATWVASGLAGGQVSFDLLLLPNEQQVLPAFVQVLRARGVVAVPAGPALVGSLFVTDATGDLRGVSVAAKTSTTGDGGRYGVFYSAVPAGSEPTTSAWLYDLQQDANNRTNLALVNAGSADASADTFRVDLFDGTTGQVAGSVDAVTVPAMGFVQIDSILRQYAPASSSGYALVTKMGGNNPFLTYAVINDGGQPGQRSGDGAFVKADSLPQP